MKFDFLFILVAFVYYASTLITLQGGLSNQTPCPAMDTGFNTTIPNVYWKLNGTHPYTCFAITDPASASAPNYTTSILNYHLVAGLYPLASLPTDGTLPTDNPGDAIRITKFGGYYFVNGKVPLPTTYGEGYYDGTVITNGIMYKFLSPPGLDYPALNATNRKTIVKGLSDLSTVIKSTIASQFIQVAIQNFNPPASWTLFVPSDAAFASVPQYQQDYILNTQSAATSFLLTHAFNGTVFGYPLSLNNIDDMYEMTSLNGLKYNLSYALYNGNEQTYLLKPENNTGAGDFLNVIDGMRSDGVVHSLTVFYLPPDWNWPKPLVSEFINQYSTFSQALITELVGFYYNGLDVMISEIVKSGITIPTDITMFLIRSIDYAKNPITDPDVIGYHIITDNQYLAADLPLNTLINTYNNGSFIRIVNYQDTLWINGFSAITIADIKLGDGIIHIIDSVLTLPVSSDDTCVSCYKDITLLEDLATIPTASSFYNFILNPPVEIVAPYTLFVPTNDFIDFYNIANLNAYLATNVTALQEYIQRFLFEGFLYPTVAKKDLEINELSISAFNYTYQYNDPNTDTSEIFPTLSFVTTTNIGSQTYEARPRKDCVYYLISERLFDFPIPPPPPAPLPEPAPIVPQGLKPDNNSAASNHLSNLYLLLLGILVVLFLQ